MIRAIRVAPIAALFLLPAGLLAQDIEPASAPAVPADADAMIAEAKLAAPPSITENATFMDWEGTVLREGANGWTCMPSPPGQQNTPMCLDHTWMHWAHAWQSKGEVDIDGVGIAYMMQGDGGVSNIDPYATEPTPENEWVVGGPHLMVIVPDLSDLEGLPTDPDNGGPWVMWKDTPYAHIMVPIGDEPTRPGP